MATYREAIENKLKFWYDELNLQELYRIWEVETLTEEIIDTWSELSLDEKVDIYDKLNS